MAHSILDSNNITQICAKIRREKILNRLLAKAHTKGEWLPHWSQPSDVVEAEHRQLTFYDHSKNIVIDTVTSMLGPCRKKLEWLVCWWNTNNGTEERCIPGMVQYQRTCIPAERKRNKGIPIGLWTGTGFTKNSAGWTQIYLNALVEIKRDIYELLKRLTLFMHWRFSQQHTTHKFCHNEA